MKNKVRNLIKNSTNLSRENFRILKHNLILFIGIGLFAYNLFDFKSDKYCGGSKNIFDLSFECNFPATYYYYNDISLVLLTIGVIFIIIGSIKIKRKYSE